MPRRALRLRPRLAAVLAGAAASLLFGGVAQADVPPLPGLPSTNQPITLVISAPSVATLTGPPAPTGCVIDSSFDNTHSAPLSSVFRGQSACGSGVYAPQLTGQTSLVDIFSEVVATGNSYAQTWGVGTSQGDYAVQPTGQLPSTVTGGGPVPGLSYTIEYATSITLTWPQYWGPPAAGCSVNGQTLNCTIATTYNYIPGTQGGLTPG